MGSRSVLRQWRYGSRWPRTIFASSPGDIAVFIALFVLTVSTYSPGDLHYGLLND
jgi:hypothetical protein